MKNIYIGVAISVNEIEQKAQTELQLILWNFWGFSAKKSIFFEIFSWNLHRICNVIVLIQYTWFHWYLTKFEARKSLNIHIWYTNYSIWRHDTFFCHNSCWNFLWEFRKLLSIDCWCEINVMSLSFQFRFLGPFW